MSNATGSDPHQGSNTAAPTGTEAPTPTATSSPWHVFLIFLRLGLTSFGGPVAHIGYFRDEFVGKRKWLSEQSYADLVALCQFLPGPASSQVGFAIGQMRAGTLGAFAAWTAFTLPSAIALVLFAIGLAHFDAGSNSAWLKGFKIAAVAVVAKAVLDMMQTLTPDKERATLAVAAALVVLAMPTVWGQLLAIALGAVIGMVALAPPSDADTARHDLPVAIKPAHGLIAIAAFFVLLIALPVVAAQTTLQDVHLFDAFYRSGALVFGGGHVVLPLLQAEVVPTGYVSADQFLAGYGAAQAVPGPLFTFAAYLGAQIGGWGTAAICLIAIYVPTFLLVYGALPFWDALRRKTWAQAMLTGVNAAVVGLLLAALYNPVWTSGILSARDFALALAAFLALYMWKTPPWLVVPLCAVASGVIAMLLT